MSTPEAGGAGAAGAPAAGLVEGVVASRRDWAPGLFSLVLDAQLQPHQPGQFVNLGLPAARAVRRPYSLASAPGAPPEFLLSVVPGGALTPGLAALAPGDAVLVEPRAQGFFTLAWVPPVPELWFVATGTGLAPFLAMLRAPELWTRAEHVVLVQGVRHQAELAYRDEIAALGAAHPGQLTWLPAVSRDATVPEAWRGRLTAQLAAGALEARAGRPISGERSHVLLCGNPAMIDEVTSLLEARGLRRHRVRKPGHVTAERYW